ncbi:MAG TPA: UvrD-helicase domain-containing protein [Phototrophicaceae bacterium]|nr:UvrD-helicase domain-containing protein [Phototrophicaceae bacterium]
MTTELLLTPVGAGKTASVLNFLLEALNQQPALAFPRVWVLLPNNRQETMFRQRLIEHPAAHRVVFNVEFFDFYQLYERLLDMAGKPQRQLDHTARYRLLRSLLGRLQNQLQVYGQIAQTPGFVDNVASFIYELKQNLVEPDAFANAATTPKDHDLATIYRAYQNTLQDYHLVDREGEGWLALGELEDNPAIAADVHLLLVDGFDQFNPLQARLLARLSAHVGRALVTLPTIPGREETVGRRFRRARQQLEIAHEEYEVPLTIHEDLTGYTFDRHPALNNWLERSFLAGVQPHPSAGCLALIETPDPANEVNAVLRQVKRRLLVDGCQPDDIILAVRDWARYGGYLAQGARTYGLPIALHYGEALAHNPAIIALMNLLELAKFDFRRRRLIDVLRSPYFAVPARTPARPGAGLPPMPALKTAPRAGSTKCV